jgi:group II intron reverse transcriptase/maturase
MRNVGTFGVDANGKAASGLNHEGERTDATPRDGAPRSSEEVRESGRSEGGACSEAKFVGPTRNGRSPKDEAKPYCISRQEVLEAYKKVKSNKGAAGIDEQTIADFEQDLKNNLYRIWNRMSSGSYFPPPVRTVKIPKANGGERPLGIPTVSDRIAQMVVKNRLEPLVDPLFQPDSYGYRPKKSALDAVGRARQMCWAYNWVCDLDIKGFFDNLDHELMMRAVKKHAKEKWAVLYIERWLKAPAQDEAGNLLKRERGTPQGGVISPLLANLFLHYALDLWRRRKWKHLPFERYADDIIVHCRAKWEAELVRVGVTARLNECGLELHPEKTKIVYCKDVNRKESHPNEKFDFLGYTFRPRTAVNRKGKLFCSFSPAISKKAVQKICDEIRSWQLHRRTASSIEDLAKMLNPKLRGWFNYYGRFTPSALRPIERHVGQSLVRWACRKYKKLRGYRVRAWGWLVRFIERQPTLLALWERQRGEVFTMGAV